MSFNCAKVSDIDKRKAFEMKRDYLASKISLKIRKRVLKTCIWTKALCGCETWTAEPQERRRIEAFEMWCFFFLSWDGRRAPLTSATLTGSFVVILPYCFFPIQAVSFS